MCTHENNVPSWLLSKLLCDNSCTWADDVRLPIAGTNEQQWPLYISGLQAWRGRKRQAHGHHSPSSIQGKWLAIHGQKNNILGSLCLGSYLAANWLQKLEMKHCLLRRSYFCSYKHICVCVCVCVCLCVYVLSQFDLFITKQKYLFVRCQYFSHIPNTSLRCSNQPLWKLNLMTGVNMTKQQTREIKNTI